MKESVKVTDKRLEALREELEAKCRDLEARTKELEELRAQALRLQADFENVKKRMLKEQAEFQESANGDLLRELLEIYDDFERGLNHAPADTPDPVFRDGVEMIGKRFGDFLKSYGVVPMEAAGQLFDPARHEAVAHEATDAVPESTVLAELRRGYLMNGRVLRHAVVKVAVKLVVESNLEIIRHDSIKCGGLEINHDWLNQLEDKLSGCDFIKNLKEVHVDFGDYGEQLKFRLVLSTGDKKEAQYCASSLPSSEIVIEDFRRITTKGISST